MGNHNFFDGSFKDSFQNGLKSRSFEVDTRSNIGNNFVSFIPLTLEILDLSGKIFLLFFAGDPTIEDLSTFFGYNFLPNVIPSMPSFGCNKLDFTLEGPQSDGFPVNFIVFTGFEG